MPLIKNYKKVTYNDKLYSIFELEFKGKYYPVILDWNDFEFIQKLNKSWNITENGIYCSQIKDNKRVDISLHEVILSIKSKETNTPILNKPILHINKLFLDNRRDNLIYDTHNKPINKNLIKKARIIKFSKYSGIKSQESTYLCMVFKTRYNSR